MKIAITTGNLIHHKFLVNNLYETYPDLIKLIIVQKNLYKKKNNPPKKKSFGIGKYFFKAFKALKYGKSNLEFTHPNVIYTEDINKDDSITQKIKELNCELLILIGGKIIKPHVLESINNNVINIHNGFSPYYKGSNTLMFPVINGELEKVGITVHWATPEVDDGGIILRRKLNPRKFLFKEFMFTHSIFLSLEALKLVIGFIKNKVELPKESSLDQGDVYLAKHFTSEKKQILTKKMVKNYFKHLL